MSSTIPLAGTPCARCGFAAHSYNARTGRTQHMDRQRGDCPTRLPVGSPPR